MNSQRHAAVMDAAGFWRQFVVAFYFDKPNDKLVGTLQKHWADGPRDDLVPHIRVQTDDGRTFEVTVSQERLKAELVKASPAVGDQLTITYHGEAPKAAPGMSKAKLFTVEVTRPGTAGAETHRYDPATGERVIDPTAGRGAAVDAPGPDHGTAPMTPTVDGLPPDRSTDAAVPGPGLDEPPGYVDTNGHVHVPDGVRPDGVRPDVAKLQQRIADLPPDEKESVRAWLARAKIPDTVNVSEGKVRAVNAELDRRAAAQPSPPAP